MPEHAPFSEKNGFTLIEIITSIVLLTMVIAVMLPIFPQILNWSSQSEENLTASNLLGQVASDVKDHAGNLPLDGAPACGRMRSLTGGDLSALPSYPYTVELNVCKEEDVHLYRTNIQIFSEDDKLLSESYTYIKAGGSG
ncbi:type II secretion system protein [Lentibacillus cibarius]|uniref:Type II secretion system protein n=2 Tax=Lentibacillus cibarius TaxID=2583219 RepID=A0A5S3QI53_9BACI|nr:type II secretion system protein [Lentibacillus cibarius]TMN21590.1 type II secretion system protein [Lentibacillus cibarius]